jgi:hypothetical protein
MDMLNLSSPEARTRVKARINQRYREVQSTLNLARTRRSLGTMATVSGQATVTASGVAKIFGLYDGAVRHQALEEVAVQTMLQREAQLEEDGTPREYAIQTHINDVVVVRFYPRPNAVLTLDTDVLAAGTNMTDDEDEPSLPVDFHDVLVRGPLADELRKMGKFKEAETEEDLFQRRLADLRYFLVKSAVLREQSRDAIVTTLPTRRTWPYGNVGL